MTEDQIFEKFEVKSSSILKKKRYSGRIIKNFFQPLFSGIFLENELRTSRRIFEYTFKMMMEGYLTIPSEGIGAIPAQLAENFNRENFIFNASAHSFSNKYVEMDNGLNIKADIFIIATNEYAMRKILGKNSLQTEHRSATNLYFSANEKPFKDSLICVNANDPKLINSVAVLTNIYSGFAPKGKELISISINGFAKANDEILEAEVKTELKEAFGNKVLDWELLRINRIDYAIPNQNFVLGKRQITEIKTGNNTYVCGDHLLYGSVNAAMKTGKMVAEVIHKDFNPGHKIEQKKRYDSLFGKEV